LSNQHIYLAQLRDNLFGFVALVGHLQSSFYSTIGWTNSKGEDHDQERAAWKIKTDGLANLSM